MNRFKLEKSQFREQIKLKKLSSRDVRKSKIFESPRKEKVEKVKYVTQL